MHIVLNNPGAAGDMVTALIDDTDYYFPSYCNGQILTVYSSLRADFRRLHQDGSLNESTMSILIPELEKKYRAVNSHRFETFLPKDYPTVIIDDSDEPWYKLTGARFNRLVHTGKYSLLSDDFILQRRSDLIYFVNEYRSNSMVIKFQDIIEGNLIKILQPYFEIKDSQVELYTSWLEVNKLDFLT